jgi:hypothetical protein
MTWKRRIPSLVAAAVVGAAVALLPCRRCASTTAAELLERVRTLNRTTRKWDDRTQKVELRVVNRRGGERRRSLVIRLKKYPQDRNRTIVFFESPAEVKGVSFLQWADPHASDDQWLYLPAMKRVRKISGAARRESFVGTDFSYDDLAVISQITDWSNEDATATAAPAEELDGVACQTIDFKPTGKDLAYDRIRVWFRADDLVILKFEMFGTGDELEKVLTQTDIHMVGSIPTAQAMTMKNVRTGSYTEARFTTVKYDSGLADDEFTQRAMERGL